MSQCKSIFWVQERLEIFAEISFSHLALCLLALSFTVLAPKCKEGCTLLAALEVFKNQRELNGMHFIVRLRNCRFSPPSFGRGGCCSSCLGLASPKRYVLEPAISTPPTPSNNAAILSRDFQAIFLRNCAAKIGIYCTLRLEKAAIVATTMVWGR